MPPKKHVCVPATNDFVVDVQFHKFSEKFFRDSLTMHGYNLAHACFYEKVKSSNLYNDLLSRDDVELRCEDKRTKLPGATVEKFLFFPTRVLWCTDIAYYRIANTNKNCKVYGCFLLNRTKIWVCVKSNNAVKTNKRRVIGPKLRWHVFEKYKRACCVCGSRASDGVKLEIDHIVPVSKGGTNDLENLQILCEHCNRGKGALYERKHRAPGA